MRFTLRMARVLSPVENIASQTEGSCSVFAMSNLPALVSRKIALF